jgi:hypothetical protein
MRLSRSEKTQLAATLRCSARDLPRELRKYADAAAEEYVRMILGQHVYTRGQDIREYRLFLLILHAFAGLLPDERTISALFQTTTTQSRALLRAVMSKYQYELQGAIRQTLETHLRAAVPDPSEPDLRNLTVDSENVVEALNREIAAIDGTLPQITKARGTVTTFEIRKSSYEQLQLRFGI